jgi:hypothetical protein
MRGRIADFRWRAAARAAAALKLAALLLLAPLAHVAVARGGELAPFDAQFNVVWRGMGAGTAHLTLKRGDGSRWTYSSQNVARGLFKLAVPGEIRQSSELRIQDEHVVPLHFLTDDGSSDTRRDSDVRFDWQAGRATGTAEGRKVDAALVPGLQDTLSVQIALINELVSGRTPTSFELLDRDEVKTYQYIAEGHERITTAMGTHDTVKYRSRRPDSDRSTVFWCAPDLGYLPLKVERHKGSKIEWAMSLTQLKRDIS